MGLTDELISLAERKIIFLQGVADGQGQITLGLLNLIALKPDGLNVFTRASIDMGDFSKVIEANRSELRPWIMVYPAALGLEGPWETVLLLWSRTEIPKSPKGKHDAIAPIVEDSIKALFTGYCTLITT